MITLKLHNLPRTARAFLYFSLLTLLLMPDRLLLAQNTARFAVTHGVAVGEVENRRAVLWARTDREAFMHVSIKGVKDIPPTKVTADSDYTGKIFIRDLKPDTRYRYRVWFNDSQGRSRGSDQAVTGVFRTPPARRREQAVTFAWGGDIAGQNACRDVDEGYAAFSVLNDLDVELDFFIGLGDMIYADDVCNPTGLYGNAQIERSTGPATTLDEFRAHWKYNREDDGYRRLLAKVPYYAVWDDHEVINDFGPLTDNGLLLAGLQAFLDYNPIVPRNSTPQRLYRKIRWGKQLELFILDTRQYRDANFAGDDAAKPKTMLGREQVVWFKDALKRSSALWKVVISSVPMAIPTGAFPNPEIGRDGWSGLNNVDAATGLETGFEYELLDILRFMKDNGIDNSVWLTTDVHFAAGYRYQPFADDSDFLVHEFVSGPMSAIVLPNFGVDPDLHPTQLFSYAPASINEVTDGGYTLAKSFFNFGLMQIDEGGRLSVSIINALGDVAAGESLLPVR